MSGTEQAWRKVESMTMTELERTWAALARPQESQNTSYPGVTLADWCEMVYSELNRRNHNEAMTGICCGCESRVPCNRTREGVILTDYHKAFGCVCRGSQTVPQVAWDKDENQIVLDPTVEEMCET